MMRSLYSGVAGLKTHQIRMDVIGNNIANVNTTAFKSSSMVFSELMSQTTQRASGPNPNTGLGGTNAVQIGLGVKGGSVNINITGQGSAQSTGNAFDLMITGENFFVVNNGVQNFFTRDGSFYVDGAGNLAMTSIGYNVMGWQVDPETGDVRKDTVSALRIMSAVNLTYPPEATSQAYMSGIIDSNDTDVTSVHGRVVNFNFFDALGYSYTARFVFKQSDNVHEYSLELEKIVDSTGKEVDLSKIDGVDSFADLFGGSTRQDRAGKVTFDSKNYTWKLDEDSTHSVLVRNGEIVADLSAIYDGGVLRDRDEKVTWTNKKADGNEVEVEKTVQQCLDEIAKAYGYEGATDEFLNLLVAPPTSDNDETPINPPITVLDMLTNLAKTPTAVDDPDKAVTVGNTATLPTTGELETVGRNFTGVLVTYDPDNGTFSGIDGQPLQTTATLNLSELGGNFSDIVIDFSTTSNYDNKGTSTINATSGDLDGLGTGRRVGKMIGVSIQQDGRIYATYDNGMTRLLGQIATASFANASGLEKNGDNLYSATLNSGEFDGIGEDITAGGGYMSSGMLEMSNVDLSAEFTEMITTQRGFQANSRIITVSDTLLEELTNLKR